VKYPLTISYITGREEPKLHWFLDSLGKQIQPGEDVKVVVVDFFGRSGQIYADWVKVVAPKPTVWQGPHRLTKDNWWSASNSRNSSICLCRTPWIAFLDDRSILTPSWLQSIRHAMDENYAVFGAYEKVTNLVVENGFPISMDVQPNGSGKDPRETHVKKENLGNPFKMGGEWAFGCNLALPLEWALNVGGYDETCDGLSMEDCIFGLMLQNRGYDLRYDTRMKILEDRTPSALGTPMIRRDKGVSPNDKSHALLAMLKDRKTAMHGFDIREVRRKKLAGEPWPAPWGPEKDWYDGQPVSEMI